MADTSFAPYTYFQCPCSDHGSSPANESSSRPSSSHQTADGEAGGTTDSTDEHTFDPRSPRANYSLYPLEYLLYCEDCHQIRCPRCVAEEIVTYYCPSCLFEVPTTSMKDGNRCTRSCFQCPICIAPLSSSTNAPPKDSKAPGDESQSKAETPATTYSLYCGFCNWKSDEVGIVFNKANSLYPQLAKMRNGGRPRLVPKKRKPRRELGTSIPSAGSGILASSSLSAAMSVDDTAPSFASSIDPSQPTVEGMAVDSHFRHLRTFYTQELLDSGGGSGLLTYGEIGSPVSLSRIMNMYNTNPGSTHITEYGQKKILAKIRGVREAHDETEGFMVAQLDESEAIARLHEGIGSCNHEDEKFNGWDATASTEQLAAQPDYIVEDIAHRHPHFLDDLRPIPVLLRTKRSKRCPLCRHIISKPEAKSTNSRFRIRLVAGSYIPSISIRPLLQPVPPPPAVKSSRSAPTPAPPSNILEPMKPVQYILTFKNPIFESVKVTLATPSTTPGRFASKVTVLCPQFEIDSNTDVWDDALRDSATDAGAGGSRSSNRRDEGGQQQAVAGKIWERGRNWVSIVVEVVPPSLSLDLLAMTSKPIGNVAEGQSKKIDLSPLREDEDIVEIPMFVRIEWETDAAQDGVGAASGKDKDAKEKRELAYWCVLGIGRIRH